jgi:phosphoenolpyruvate synthase/pyruvate phosphate dikinase
MECRAMKRVREEMGLTNVEVMVPQSKQEGFDTVAFRREIAAKTP